MAEELKKEMEDKERSQQQLSQAIVDKEQELIKAREYVSLCLSLSVSVSRCLSVCLSLFLSPPPPPQFSLFLFSSFCFSHLSFFVVPMHSLELAIVNKEQELIKAREYNMSLCPPPHTHKHTLSLFSPLCFPCHSFFLSFLFTVPMHSCGGDITIYTCCIYIISAELTCHFFSSSTLDV